MLPRLAVLPSTQSQHLFKLNSSTDVCHVGSLVVLSWSCAAPCWGPGMYMPAQNATVSVPLCRPRTEAHEGADVLQCCTYETLMQKSQSMGAMTAVCSSVRGRGHDLVKVLDPAIEHRSDHVTASLLHCSACVLQHAKNCVCQQHKTSPHPVSTYESGRES